MLDQLRNEQQEAAKKLGTKWISSDHVFVTEYGKHFYPNTISKWFKDFLTTNNLPKLNFHGLRHTCATYLINSGLDLASVSAQLGHSDVNVTARTYINRIKTGNPKVANAFTALFNKK